jgi:hypothetical protein
MRAVLDGFKKTSLDQRKLKSAKLSRKELNYLQGGWRCENHVVDTMNDSVRGELL